MSRALRTALAIVWGTGVALAGGVTPAQGPTPSAIPTVSFAVPHDLSLGGDGLDAELAALFRALPSPGGDVPLRVEVIPGSDYQILDWLARSTVDAAVVPHLTVHLLRGDGIEVLDVTPQHSALVAPRRGAVSYTTTSDAGAREPRARFERFVAELLEATRARPSPPAPSDGRLVLGSHLSSSRFLVPVAEADRLVERALEWQVEGWRRAEIRERFWTTFFNRVVLDVAGVDGSFQEVPAGPSGCPDAGKPGVVSLCFGQPVQDRVVIRRPVVEELFGTPPLRPLPPPPALPRELERLFGDGSQGGVPSPFRPVVTAEPFFGTRVFAFRVEEIIEVLRLHRRLAERRGLALVLPGGGVKAAYQTGLVEQLYRRRLLVNAAAGPGGGEPAIEPLAVDAVIGTSGGALLSFFVARLGRDGPFDLSELLWKRQDLSGKRVFLTASDIFGWTDLPRYVSVVTIYLVFVVFLSLASVPRNGWLCPEPETRAGRHRRSRPLLLTLLAVLLLGTPLAVRWVTGKTSLEHVAEFEGMLYALLVGIALYADQCVLAARTRSQGATGAARPVWAPPVALVTVGVLLVIGPLVARLFSPAATWLEGRISAGAAYLLVGLVTAGIILSRVERGRGMLTLAARLGSWLGAFAVGTLSTLAVFWTPGDRWLHALDRIPLLLVVLGAIPLLFAVLRLVEKDEGEEKSRLRRAYGRATTGIWRQVGSAFALLVACLLIFDLTRPEAAGLEKIRSAGPLALGDLFTLASKIDTPRGGLLVCLGALLLMTAVILVVQRLPTYYLQEGVDFTDAVVFVLVGQIFTVYAVLAVLAVLPYRLTFFELTPDFWSWLLLLAVLTALGLLAWARRPRRGRIGMRLRKALRYLCDRHPDALLVRRRFVRIAILAVLGLAWWNFVLAPGLYGNRYARQYFREADGHFRQAYLEAYPRAGEAPSYRFTARFLTPASALEADETRFVLAVSGDEPCPEVPSTPGARWHRFRVLHGRLESHQTDDCEDLPPEEASLDRLRDSVFASGSVFPVFPPRRVQLTAGGEREPLVDGGYSNNVPVEGAVAVGAGLALVVYSSDPVPEAEEPRDPARRPYGPLIDGLPRLLGFLYQRSQQIDRRSRGELFVASLAPAPDPSWPFLTDFRAATVRRMLDTAAEDLDARIGRVESWGPPRARRVAELPVTTAVGGGR